MKLTKLVLLIFMVILLSANKIFSQGYYKDIFMDGGVDLISRQSLAAREYLNLSMEFIATEDAARQNSLMVSNLDDENGVLLYPDGAPRFRVIYTNGAKCLDCGGLHAPSLGETGKDRIRQFFANGGSYTGSCSGAILASSVRYGIWPGYTTQTGLNTSTLTGHFITPDSPLLNYFDFGNDGYIANITHGGGMYADEKKSYPPETEALLRYDYPAISGMHNKISCWAYKKVDHSGRIVVIGSHPEFDFSGEGLELMAAILQYAIDGFGMPQLKSTLANGELRIMDKNTSDNAPAFTKIGDRQCHHFMVRILPGDDSLKVSLDGNDNQPFNLYIKKDGFAFRNNADYADTSTASDKMMMVSGLTPGDYYIGVECDTSVMATYSGWGYSYSGNLAVLNGADYSILAEWKDPNAWPKNVHFSRKFLKAGSDSIIVSTDLYNPFAHDVNLILQITSSDSVEVETFPLFDDGLHHDSLAGDGFYCGQLGPLSFEKNFSSTLIVEDISGGYQNNFPCNGYFTTIGPLTLDHYEITSGDTIPNPGNGLNFQFTLKNEGMVSSALNVSSKFVLLDTFSSTINPQNIMYYGDIQPNETMLGDKNQFISIKANSPANTYTRFRLDIFSDERLFWSDTFSVFIQQDPAALTADAGTIISSFALYQNYPNPFNPQTQITFTLPKTDKVILEVYNTLGQKIESLLNRKMPAGSHEVQFKPQNLPSGIYFYRITAGEYQQVRKMVFLK